MHTVKKADDTATESFDAMTALVSGIGEVELAQIQRGFRERTLAAGTKIAKQGDFQDFVYIIKSGRAKISKASTKGQDSTIAIVGPGDEVGMSSLFSEDSGVNCVALDELTVLYSTRDTLLFLMQSIPCLATNVARILSRRIGQLEERISSFVGGSLPRRLSIALLKLSNEGTPVTGGGVQLSGAITHEFLASLVGASREAVTLALGKLRESGAIVQISKGTLVVRPAVLNESISASN